MRISDWSSDVCSSDLSLPFGPRPPDKATTAPRGASREGEARVAAIIDPTQQPASRAPRPWWTHLYVQVLAAIAAGVLIGHYWPDSAVQLKPVGDGFIKLVQILIHPVLFPLHSTDTPSAVGSH